jgi:hypothetical protein
VKKKYPPLVRTREELLEELHKWESARKGKMLGTVIEKAIDGWIENLKRELKKLDEKGKKP